MGSLRMLFYVIKCFPVNLEKLTANAVRGLDFDGIDQDIQSQGGLVAEALGKADHQVDEVGALDANGTHVGDHAAELAGLVFNGLLEVGEAGGGLFGGG